MTEAITTSDTADKKIAFWFGASLAAMPVLLVFAPRALAGVPGIAGLVAWLALAITAHAWPGIARRAAFAALGIVAISFLSMLWAVDPDRVLSRTIKTAPILLGLVMMVSCAVMLSPSVQARGFRFFPFAAIGGAGMLLLDYLTGNRIFGFLTHGALTPVEPSLLNRSAVFISLCLFPALGALPLTEFSQRKRKCLGLVLAAATIAAAFMASSQSAQIALLAGGLSFLLFPVVPASWRKPIWILLGLVIALFFFASPFLARTAFQYADMIDASSYFGDGGAYGAQRLEIWNFVSTKILEHPLLGYGMEAARNMHFQTEQRFYGGDTVLHPHNMALQIWLEFGAVGIALLISFIWWIMSRIRSMDFIGQRYALSTFVMVLTIASTAYGIWQGWWVGLLTLIAAWLIMLHKTAALRA